MTRLVGVRAVCDVCSAARAVLFCVIHRHVSCIPCDTTVHENPAEAAHQRVDLSCAVTALPFCEHCDKAPATSYCESEGTTLCDQCDLAVHRNRSCTAHEHRLISKALAQRTVSFTGLPPPTVVPPVADQATAATTNVRKTVAPHSPRGKPRRRGASSPMKRRSKRENMSQSSSEERNILDVAARTQAARNRHAPPAVPQNTTSGQQHHFTQHLQGVHPQQLASQAGRSAPLSIREASPNTQTSVQQSQISPSMPPDNQLAYMHAMALMGHREPVDFFSAGMQGFFTPDLMPMPSTDANLMLDEGNTPATAPTRRYPTNIAPHPGVASAAALGRLPMSTHHDASTVAAAAAAAATAAGEMFLLSATSSDQPSGSSEGFTPAFSGLTSSPDAAGLAAAATAAAESTVAAIGGHTIRPSAQATSPNELNTESFIMHRPGVNFEEQQRRLSKPRRVRSNYTDMLDDDHGMVDVQRSHLFERPQQQFGDPSSSGHLTDAQDMRVVTATQNRTDHLSNHHDGVTDLGGGDERDHYHLTDFDIPRDDFGAFDALDLSSFEHNSVSNFGISSQRSTGCSMDDGDHNS